MSRNPDREAELLEANNALLERCRAASRGADLVGDLCQNVWDSETATAEEKALAAQIMGVLVLTT